VFSRAVDAYSYGMTCHEILTGKLLFEDHPLSDNLPLLTDLVINQHLCLEVPKYVEDWTCKLLSMCWNSDPMARPTFREILDLILANSSEIIDYDELMKKYYGQDFRK
jgi:serine/threonine protein kinase